MFLFCRSPAANMLVYTTAVRGAVTADTPLHTVTACRRVAVDAVTVRIARRLCTILYWSCTIINLYMVGWQEKINSDFVATMCVFHRRQCFSSITLKLSVVAQPNVMHENIEAHSMWDINIRRHRYTRKSLCMRTSVVYEVIPVWGHQLCMRSSM